MSLVHDDLNVGQHTKGKANFIWDKNGADIMNIPTIETKLTKGNVNKLIKDGNLTELLNIVACSSKVTTIEYVIDKMLNLDAHWYTTAISIALQTNTKLDPVDREDLMADLVAKTTNACRPNELPILHQTVLSRYERDIALVAKATNVSQMQSFHDIMELGVRLLKKRHEIDTRPLTSPIDVLVKEMKKATEDNENKEQ